MDTEDITEDQKALLANIAKRIYPDFSHFERRQPNGIYLVAENGENIMFSFTYDFIAEHMNAELDRIKKDIISFRQSLKP